MGTSLQESISRQRNILSGLLAGPLAVIAVRCAEVWGNREAINQVLIDELRNMQYCKFLYALDIDCIQISDNVSHTGLITKDFGRDRSSRPYMNHISPSQDFYLSDAYISLRARRPSLTAIQLVKVSGKVVGFIGADFDLRDLPITSELYDEPGSWRQIKGDPSIRATVFMQKRTESILDRHIDEVLGVMDQLITEHGVFHGKIHFSSSRATIWLYSDPYRYRILDVDSLIDPDVCLAYPITPYPDEAIVPPEMIRPILERLRGLRYADDTLYLRAGSLNIMNGIVNLTFSCDGSHYLSYDEFMSTDKSFWGGQS
jgi:hypothetical protein